MSKVQNSGQGNNAADQIKEFTIQAANVLTAAGPGLLIIVIIVAAIAAAYVEIQYHQKVVGDFAYISGGGYGMFRFAVGTAAVQVGKERKWIPATLFILISLVFTTWSSFHVGTAAEILRIGGTAEAAKMILLTILWTAFCGELCLGVFSFVMDKGDEGNE
ncbi:MAG: hypothetical protein R2828_31335 [Saprospiraceae bacterium]